MFDNEKFLMEIAYLHAKGLKLMARCKAFDCPEFTTRMKALQIVGVVPLPA